MKPFNYEAQLCESYYDVVQHLNYYSDVDKHDLNISPEFHSVPDSSFSREKSVHGWSTAVMSPRFITSGQALACSVFLNSGGKVLLQINIDSQ